MGGLSESEETGTQMGGRMGENGRDGRIRIGKEVGKMEGRIGISLQGVGRGVGGYGMRREVGEKGREDRDFPIGSGRK